jgi:hypothetical protein
MRIQMRGAGWFSRGMIVAGLVILTAGSAAATPVAIDETAFSGAETVITFDGFPIFTPLTTQYLPEGVTFSGGLYSSNPGGLAQNFTPTNPASPVTIDFTSTMLRAGFNVVTASSADLVVALSAYSGDVLVSTGMVTFDTGQTMSFVGVEDDMSGIDRLVLDTIGGGSGTFRLDNLRFEPAPIPEPSAALLFPIGFFLAASSLRRRRG